MDELIKRFQAANPGITVKQTTFPYADYQTKVAAAIPAGQGPDVVQLFYGWLDKFVGAKLPAAAAARRVPARARSRADFFPIVSAMKRDGEYYGLPTAVRSLALFYNKKLFQEAGLDPSEAAEDARRVRRGGREGDEARRRGQHHSPPASRSTWPARTTSGGARCWSASSAASLTRDDGRR